jgi:hypothetical protein
MGIDLPSREPEEAQEMHAQQRAAPPHNQWGNAISEKRKAELQDILDKWHAPGADHGDRKGPFDRMGLAGDDVSWLAERLRSTTRGDVYDLHLEGAWLSQTFMNYADLLEVHLEGADLRDAHLKCADLTEAHLEGANLEDADLEGANLTNAHLEGTNLRRAHLKDATLTGALLDSKTMLIGTTLDAKTRLADIQWSGVGTVNLTQIDWSAVRCLGDETQMKRDAKPQKYFVQNGMVMSFPNSQRAANPRKYESAVRAYRQVAAQLRAQGLNEVADRFTYRAQVCQRSVLLRRGQILGYLGSWILALLAGYGFRPLRTVGWYLAVIATFTVLFMQATAGWVPFGLPAPSGLAPLPWYEALILSISSFHGRGFFQPLQSPGDPIAALAAIEAVVGLLIEVTFIATFTQRFFGAK